MASNRHHESSKEKKKIKKDTIYASMAFVMIVVFLGIPLWWKTTEVYRVPLPYDQVDKLASAVIPHIVPVTLVLADDDVDAVRLARTVTIDTDTERTAMPLHVIYKWAVRDLFAEEITEMKSSQTLSEFADQMHIISPESFGKITIYILPKANHLTRNPITVGVHRQAFVINSDVDTLEKDILATVKDVIVREDVLTKVFVPISTRLREQPDKETMLPVDAVPILDVVFTLIVPEPEIFDVHWDIKGGEQAYIKPLVDKLLPFTKVNIKSQILYMVSLNVKSKLDSSVKEYMLSADKLPLIVNPTESKLGTHISVNPALNFVVYIPPVDQSPLYIYDEKGSRVEKNAFLSPRWGGFTIYNIASESKAVRPQRVDVDMQKVMEVFVSQFRLLTGLPQQNSMDDNPVSQEPSPLGTDFELDFLLRRRTQEHLSEAVSSLKSLTQLLGTIKNIVIRDEIGEKINEAVESINASLLHLRNGQLLEAVTSAQQAFVSSEQAFFDPSLLAFLYFPNDQKYAIYIPLFLPVSLPVVLSLRTLWKHFAGGVKKQKKD